MPRLNGFGLCKQLKDSPRPGACPWSCSVARFGPGHRTGLPCVGRRLCPKSEAHSQLIETIERVLERSAFHRHQRVMVVDDSRTVRLLVAKAWRVGFPGIGHGNGFEALRCIGSLRPDLFISDIDMSRDERAGTLQAAPQRSRPGRDPPS